TGHPGFYVFYASLKRKGGQYVPESYGELMDDLDHYHIHYLVVEPHMQFRQILAPMNLVAKALMDQFPERFRLIYATPKHAIGIYESPPPPPPAPPQAQPH